MDEQRGEQDLQAQLGRSDEDTRKQEPDNRHHAQPDRQVADHGRSGEQRHRRSGPLAALPISGQAVSRPTSAVTSSAHPQDSVTPAPPWP